MTSPIAAPPLKTGQHTVLLLIESLSRMGAGFVVSIMIARKFGPEGLGEITSALSWVSIFLGFSALGLSGVLVRDLVERSDLRGTIVYTVAVAKALAGAILIAAMILTVMLLGESPSVLTLSVVMGLGFLFTSMDTVDLLYQARVEFVRLVTIRMVALTVSTGVKLIAISSGAPLIYVAFGYAVDYILVYLLPFLDLVLRRRNGIRDGTIRFAFSLAEIARLLKSSWPIMISGGLAQVNLKIDVIIIAALSGLSSVGIYSAAARISEAWSVVAMALVTAFFPHLVKLARTDVPAYGLEFARLLRRLLWISIGGAVFVYLTADFIILLVYGDEFAQSAGVLSVHIFAGVFLFIRTAVSRWLIVEGLFVFSLYSHAAGAVTNIIANFLLIPQLGVIGAAWASVLSYAVSSLGFLAFGRRTRPLLLFVLLSIFPSRCVSGRLIRQAEVMVDLRMEKNEK